MLTGLANFSSRSWCTIVQKLPRGHISPLSLDAMDETARRKLALALANVTSIESPMAPARPTLRKQTRIDQLIERCNKHGYELVTAAPTGPARVAA
jgi:hypothetical protein